MRRTPTLTEQVKRHLKERILADEFVDGRIPPENELAADLGVSRTTIRDALSRLENEGAIYRRQGAGTFVSDAGMQIRSRLEEIWSYEAVLEAHGYTPSVKVVVSRVEAAGTADARKLDIAEGAELLVIGKVFLEDSDPVVLTYNRVPTELITRPLEAGDDGKPVFELLDRYAGRDLSYYLSEIVPLVADSDVAGLLEIDEGAPLLSFDEVGYDRANRPVVQATSFFRDDLLRFRLIRREAPTA